MKLNSALLTAGLLIVEITSPAQDTTFTSPTPTGQIYSSNVVAKVTGNRWAADALIASGTLTNISAVPVTITNLTAIGYDENQWAIVSGSDFTILHADLAPGETEKFKAALSDTKKAIRFVKITPYVTIVSTPASPPLSQPENASIKNIAALAPKEVAVVPQQSGNAFAGFIIVILCIGAYFLPGVIAAARHHRNANAIFLLNLFFGWSVLGWLIALIWSATGNVIPKSTKVISSNPPEIRPTA